MPTARIALFLLSLAYPLSAESETANDKRGELELEMVPIVGVAPVPGIGQPLERVPANVQVLDAGELKRAGALNLGETLGRTAGGVHVGQTQNNPFQPDLTYRGFVGSSLLGVAQGLSVFSDGVRVNEFLGDTVNFDLLPEDAIASIEIVPGSNPLYGRNTLGGALAIETKRGFTHPGSELEAYYGSFDRRRFSASTGGSAGRFDYFATANLFREDGFRDFSPSEVNQLFGEGGWRDGDHDLRLTYTAVHNELTGNSVVPESFLARDRGSVYTWPDVFRPDLHFVHLLGERRFGVNLRFRADVYFRGLRLSQFNADAEDEPDDGEGGDPLPGVNRFVRADQRRYGGTAGASYSHRPLGGENDFALGVQVDRGNAGFELFEEEGFVNAQRTVISTGSRTLRTDVDTDGTAVGAFATDTFSPAAWLSVTPSVRYDRASLTIDDRLGGRASGSHTFDRFNPAFGLTIRPDARLHFFGNWSESFRAPTAIELTCASADDPCPVPIAFAEDPPLNEVRARTLEAGLRAKPLGGWHLKLAFFRTDLDDDILFVSSTRSLGFFRNVGETRRQGVEWLLDGRLGIVHGFANYSYTRATFETSESLPSPVGENLVRPGDVIPGVPDHLLKAGFDALLGWSFRAGIDLAYTGRQFLRTDESNTRPPLPGYMAVNAHLEYMHGPLTLFARAENLFDAEYETGGSQAENVFEGGRLERFLSPGAPLGGWFGVRVEL